MSTYSNIQLGALLSAVGMSMTQDDISFEKALSADQSDILKSDISTMLCSLGYEYLSAEKWAEELVMLTPKAIIHLLQNKDIK
jgi:hypothetical protein